MLCQQTDQCGSINFKPDAGGGRGVCELNEIFFFVLSYNDNEIISDDEWQWYEFK